MKKRLLSFLMALCLMGSLLAIPAGAAAPGAVTFRDISDHTTAVAVESMRLLGVVDGYKDGSFRPNQPLNRAQFCKMAVYAMGSAKELGRYRTITIYPDVKPSYWAAPYINLLSRSSAQGSKNLNSGTDGDGGSGSSPVIHEKPIISGFADGKFHPGDPATVGQAVTILMRMLGYQDENMGGVWPQSYMTEAAIIGLTDGVSTNAYAPITRGQAAKLFANLLRANLAEGGSFAATLGTPVENLMVISSEAKGSNGVKNALEVSNGSVYTFADNKGSNGLFDGTKGTLIVNAKGQALTFLPDNVGSNKVVTVATAEANRLTDLQGAVYTMSPSLAAYHNGKETTWGEVYTWLNAGTSVTLYLDAGGNVNFVLIGGGAQSSAAVIVDRDQSSTGFDSLAGGRTDFKIYKNGMEASGADLRRYDVATYSSTTNTIRVSDTRITGYYESCKPSPKEPSEITMMGHNFPVLSTAIDTLADFRPGDQLTLLLTEDNQVAGALPATSGNAGNAMGIVKEVSEGSATVDLLCGITVSGKANLAAGAAEALQGQLVRVSSTKSGLGLANLKGGATGDLNAREGKLGGKVLAENVMIFRQSSKGLVSTSLSQLGSALIPANQITYATTDWAGRISLIVLGETSDQGTYYYGKAVTWTDEGKTMLEVQYGDGKSVGPFETGYRVSNGSYVRVTLNRNQDGYSSLETLDRLRDVPNSAWSGQGAVTVGGRTYQVPSDVFCYNRTTKTTLSLSAAHAYAQQADLYVYDGIVYGIEVD